MSFFFILEDAKGNSLDGELWGPYDTMAKTSKSAERALEEGGSEAHHAFILQPVHKIEILPAHKRAFLHRKLGAL